MQSTALKKEPATPLYIYKANGLPYRTTFNTELFDQFLAEYDDRKGTTVKGYRTYIKRFRDWLADNEITQPTRDDVKAYKIFLNGSGLAVGTQAQYLRAVRQFFRWAFTNGFYDNVADNIQGAKVRHDVHKKDALERDDVAKIAGTIDRSTETGKRDYAIFMLCITCGLRCVEVSRANICDIKQTGGKYYLWVQGKGHDEPDAPVWIIPAVKECLDEYLEARTTPTTPKAPLFTSTSNRSKGKRIAPQTISGMIKRILKAAGYDSDRLTAHSLRHTSATGCYNATGDIYLTSKHQRHADVSTTEIYVHAQEREQRETEQQVYDYYFNRDGRENYQRTAADMLAALDANQTQRVIEFIKSIQ